jgi:hypothetical protein
VTVESILKEERLQASELSEAFEGRAREFVLKGRKMFARRIVRRFVLATLFVAGFASAGAAFAAYSRGRVLLGGASVAKSTVTLWAASEDQPK